MTILQSSFPRRISRSLLRRSFTTAYSGVAGDGRFGLERLPYLPLVAYTTTDQQCDGRRVRRQVQVDAFAPSEWQDGMDLMNLVIREGKSWPFESEFTNMTDYRAYFLSHTAFCVRAINPGPAFSTKQSTILGCFYIKPNFPDRCSHVCNGGFITAPHARQQGIGTLMGHVFLQAARDLGYKSSYFNLVFRSNAASVRLWESLGFERVAVLKDAARLEGVEGLDTAYGYWYDLTTLPSDYLFQYYAPTLSAKQ